MDEIPRQDGPSAAAKLSKPRGRKRKPSLKDGEPRPEPKRRSRKKVPAKTELEDQESDRDPGLTHTASSRGLPYTFPSTRIEPVTNLDRPLSPLFGITSPQESWMVASESPSPITQARFPPYPRSFNSLGNSSLPSLNEHNNSTGTNIFLDQGHMRRGHVREGAKDDTRSPERLLGSFGMSLPIGEPGSYIMDHDKASCVNAGPSGYTNGENSINGMNARSMLRGPSNRDTYMSSFPPQLSTTLSPLSPLTNHASSYTPLSSGTKLHQMKCDTVGDSALASNGSEPAPIVEWHPASLLSMDNHEPESQYSLLVLNQPIRNLNVLKLVWNKAFFHIAADGGANRLSDAFRDPCIREDFEKIGLDVICGDLDSLLSKVKEDALRRGTKIIEDPDQYSTDFQKCIVYLRKDMFRGWPSALNIVCLGGLGGRVDQAMSQLHHLYLEQQDPQYKNGRVYLLSTESITFVLKSGNHRIEVRNTSNPVLGKHIGIIPLKEPSIITTKGLEWDVTDWLTELGGQISTSNHVREDVVEITTTRDVLFTIDLDVPAGNHEHPELKRETTPIISVEDNMFFGTETNHYSYSD